MTARAEIYARAQKDGDPRYYFRVIAANGEIVAQSEGYTSKASAEKGLRALRRSLLPAYRDNEQELNAASWQRGWLFAYYQLRGHAAGAADLKSQATPHPALQELVDKNNPYKDTPAVTP